MLQLSNEYLFGGILASILGILFLLKSVNYFNPKKRNIDNETAKVKSVDDDHVGYRRECGVSHDGPEVIIVGAGVAGSALACTLGKFAASGVYNKYIRWCPVQVFSASPDKARNEMRQACFDYLGLGGVYSTGPVALLSGLNPRPLSLVCHVFAVAIYGIGRLLLPFPSLKRLWVGARLVSADSSIIFPIIKAEGFRQMFFPATVPACCRAPPSNRRQRK